MSKTNTPFREKPTLKHGEEWRDVHDGLYAVSSCGKVWSYRKQTLLPQHLMKNGYLRVNLWLNKLSRLHSVHRLVCTAFHPNLNGLPLVNHKDDNKANNHRNNLHWATSSENTLLAIESGSMKIGDEHYESKLSSAKVKEIFKARALDNATTTDLAAKYNVSRRAIRNILDGISWKHVECPERELASSIKRVSTKGKRHKKKREYKSQNQWPFKAGRV